MHDLPPEVDVESVVDYLESRQITLKKAKGYLCCKIAAARSAHDERADGNARALYERRIAAFMEVKERINKEFRGLTHAEWEQLRQGGSSDSVRWRLKRKLANKDFERSWKKKKEVSRGGGTRADAPGSISRQPIVGVEADSCEDAALRRQFEGSNPSPATNLIESENGRE